MDKFSYVSIQVVVMNTQPKFGVGDILKSDSPLSTNMDLELSCSTDTIELNTQHHIHIGNESQGKSGIYILGLVCAVLPY